MYIKKSVIIPAIMAIIFQLFLEVGERCVSSLWKALCSFVLSTCGFCMTEDGLTKESRIGCFRIDNVSPDGSSRIYIPQTLQKIRLLSSIGPPHRAQVSTRLAEYVADSFGETGRSSSKDVDFGLTGKIKAGFVEDKDSCMASGLTVWSEAGFGEKEESSRVFIDFLTGTLILVV